MWTICYNALMLAAVQAELVDAKEVKYLDAVDLQQRVEQLQGAPYTWEAERFPCKDWCDERRGYFQSLASLYDNRATVELHHADLYLSAKKDAEWACELMRQIGDSKRLFYYVSVRRQALRNVRDMMGVEAFNAGWAP